MSSKRLVTVFGATGNQGSSVVNSLLADGKFSIRAITRKPDSDEAKALKSKGVEVVAGDLTKKEDVLTSLHDAYAVFANLIAGPGIDPISMGKMWADVAIEKGIKHFIWSGTVNSTKISAGKYNLPQHTSKVAVREYLELKNVPFTEVILAEYCQNYLGFFGPKLVNGVYEFKGMREVTYTTAIVDPMTATGAICVKVLNEPNKYFGKSISLFGEYITIEQLIGTYTKVTGRPARYVQISEEEFLKTSPAPFWIHIVNMIKFFVEFKKFANEDSIPANQIDPNLVTWEQFLIANKDNLIDIRLY